MCIPLSCSERCWQTAVFRFFLPAFFIFLCAHNEAAQYVDCHMSGAHSYQVHMFQIFPQHVPQGLFGGQSLVCWFIRCFVCSFLHQLGSPCMVSCFGTQPTNNMMHISPVTGHVCTRSIYIKPEPLLVLHQSSDTCL